MKRWGLLAATPAWLTGGARTLDAAIRQSAWVQADESVT
jgi:hypothetical protein